MSDKKLPDLLSGQKEGGFATDIKFAMPRGDVEGRDESYIKAKIEQVLTNLSTHLLKLALHHKKRWEAETEREKKFFGKVH